MSDTLSAEAVTITADELEATHGALAKLTRIHALTGSSSTDWHILMAARSIVSDDLLRLKFGEVPGV